MTAKIKLNAASGGGSFSLQAPSSSSNNRVITLPDIADGTLVTSQSTLDATKLSGNLPAINGSALTGISGGLGMADQWRWTTEFTQTNTHNHLATTSDWERPDSNIGIGSNPLGTGMTQSGGIFTFPSTGYYWVFFHAVAQVPNDSCEAFAMIRATENNSSYSNVCEALDTIQNQCTPNFITLTANYLARVTDTSNHKVHFRVQNSGLSVTWKGDSAINRISATFLKLGDT